MRIGELAGLAGVEPATVRYYESLGLLPDPPRTDSGYRDYDEVAAERLRFIKDAQATGLSLSEVGSILEMRDAGEHTCEHVAGLVEHHLADIEHQMETLSQTHAALTAMLERARSLDPADCVAPNRCQTIEISLNPARSAGVVAQHVHRSPAR